MADTTITTPKAYQVHQRIGTTASISVSGTIDIAGTYNVEARFNGGSWVTIASGVSSSFSGTLSNQPQGQGSLDVRLVGREEINSVSYVGIGEVFVIAGQSNASGRGTNNQGYSHPELKAGVFKNNYTWTELADPTDADPTTDTVSADSGAGGSVWPGLASRIIVSRRLPVAFVPTAKGGSSITEWLPGANHQNRATLYGSMVYRALQAGGVRCVLWWQGETDALVAMSQATYNGHLDTIANAIQADLGVKLMPCLLQNSSGITDADEQKIRDATSEAWGDNSNVLAGPDLSTLASDDTFHLTTNAKIITAAVRWWRAIQAAFGWRV